ncbi:hypothetical protein RHMOL_Rhmol09G0073500 [Rhododendron molle]|uniref:Uncharacterized protein n=1 Tax=Rhododendron molle TaxID=49168 RepID=A0ACC0MC45_RHOML|nr:hypothetical protein RHMOL_Rhmol09G0073500 [Rhododendron molle]
MASRGQQQQQHVNIPEEIVIEILRRLPIQSLLRFRCVSKLWRSTISHPKFTLSSSSSQSHLFIANRPNTPDFYSLNFQDTWPIDPRPLKPPFFDKVRKGKKPWYSFYVLGSCNGLLLVLYYADLYLWNPAIRQCAKVLSIQRDSSQNVLPMCACVTPQSGLCFDSYSDEYKAVMVSRGGLVNVISFRKKKWYKTICNIVALDGKDGKSLESGPIVKEKLHWLITGYDPNNHFPTLNQIVYFDPLTNEFVELPMPQIPNNGQHVTIIRWLRVLEGCLCMARYVYEADGEVLMLLNGSQLLAYNPDEMSNRDIPLPGNQHSDYVASYVESLSSPSAYGHEDWMVQGPDVCYFFFCSFAENDNYEEEDSSYGYRSDEESFHSTKEDNSIEEEDTSYGYCSDKESFHSTREDNLIEEEDISYDYFTDKESFHSTKDDSSIEEEDNYVFKGF